MVSALGCYQHSETAVTDDAYIVPLERRLCLQVWISLIFCALYIHGREGGWQLFRFFAMKVANKVIHSV